MTKLAPIIRARRQRAGLTIEQFAARLQVSRQRVSQIEHGRGGVPLPMLCRIAGVLGTKASTLLREAGL